MNCREDPPEPLTDKKIAEVFQDLEGKEAYIYVVMKGEIYQFHPQKFVPMLKKHCRKSHKTDEIGVPHMFEGEEPSEDWQRWQNRGHNL